MTIERTHIHLSGPLAWIGIIFINLVAIGCILMLVNFAATPGGFQLAPFSITAFILFLCLFLDRGIAVIQPNDSMVLIFVGSYSGTVTRNGLVLVNPLCGRYVVSRRLQNLQAPVLKVNDKLGNPIEIAAVIVWHVEEPAKAIFDVDRYELFVRAQSEAAIRHLANLYAYDSLDHSDPNEITLRSSVDEVSQALRLELDQRLAKAGIRVDEARITHLAYAPEIAMAMLKRQQAEAVVSARRAIVSGAVSIVSDALQGLQDTHLINLDEERKAAMVSNLLVVLCSDTQVQPVVNTGTLYP